MRSATEGFCGSCLRTLIPPLGPTPTVFFDLLERYELQENLPGICFGQARVVKPNFGDEHLPWDLISIAEAAKLLFVHPNTLRNHETPDGKWVEIMGVRIRVYRFDGGQRRYDRREIMKAMNRLRKIT